MVGGDVDTTLPRSRSPHNVMHSPRVQDFARKNCQHCCIIGASLSEPHTNGTSAARVLSIRGPGGGGGGGGGVGHGHVYPRVAFVC